MMTMAHLRGVASAAIGAAVLLAWFGRAMTSAPAAAEEPSQTPKLWAADEMKWDEDKRLPGVKSVLLWGDPQTGEHGMLRKFPAGFAPPVHAHPSVERLVVISGTIVVSYAGSTEKRLGPGSYSEIPANMAHSAKCAIGAECVFVLMSSGRFEIRPVPGK
jgi:quercetin dioxygenase-like cupin family protein